MAEDDIFERIQKQYEQKLPFVAYRKPEEKTVISFLQKNDQLILAEDFSESGFIFAPFDDQKEVVLFPEKYCEKHIFDTLGSEASEEILAEERDFPNARSEEKKEHLELLEKGLQKLKSGELQKVVLSRKEQIDMRTKEPLVLFQRLLTEYPTAFVYCWFHPKVGCWLGATPETLLKVTANRFTTMALAGTQKYKGSMDVEWGEKEKKEQQFVTHSILENLRNSGVENIEISAPYTAKAGNLLHLRTDIKGNLKNSRTDAQLGVSGGKLKNIISTLHPTPAVCGLPKEKAKEFIISEENYAREFYTGFLGELNLQKNEQRSRSRRNVENLAYRSVKKETDLYVNLRCMKIEDGKPFLFVGGGITKDSILEDEWEETVNKAETMKKVLLK